MNCGNLRCPKCGELRMDNFDHWESRTNTYGQIQWLFYRTIVIKNGWRCWALLTSCSKKLQKVGMILAVYVSILVDMTDLEL